MRSRRTPRLPAPPALSMGILNTILDASPPHLTPARQRVPHRALCEKVGNENLDKSAAAFTSELRVLLAAITAITLPRAQHMDAGFITGQEEVRASFLAFAGGLLLRIREWEKESGQPLFENVEVRFVEEGRKSDIVRKLDYERFLHRRWDSSLAEITELGREWRVARCGWMNHDMMRMNLSAAVTPAPTPYEKAARSGTPQP
jgi:hypothetical protein